jgi:excisionase family DNA binding protein
MARPRAVQENLGREHIGSKDVAAILGISISSVHKLVESGGLQAFRTKGGHRRISLESVKAVAASMDVPWKDQIELPARPTGRGSAGGGALKVLVVEDNPTAARAIGTALKRHAGRLQVLQCSDGAEALLKISEQVPDLVITDLAMQPFDGFHLIKVIRSSPRLRNIRIIVATGLNDKEIVERGGLGPDIAVYHKPVPAERYVGFIDALLTLRATP